MNQKRLKIAADIIFYVYMKNTYDMNFDTKKKKKACNEKIAKLLIKGGFSSQAQALKYHREHKPPKLKTC